MEKVAAGRPRVDVGEMGLVVTAGVDGTGGAAGRVEETGGCVEADGSDAAGGGRIGPRKRRGLYTRLLECQGLTLTAFLW